MVDLELTDPAARYEGRDGTSVVRVVIDGQRQLVELELNESWRSRLGGANLGAAVIEALHAAQGQWTSSTEERIDAAGTPTILELTESAPAGHVEFDREQALLAIGQLSAWRIRAQRELAELERRASELKSAEPVEKSVDGPREVVSVTVAPTGEITAVEIDQRWLRSAPRELLTEELLLTIQIAQESAASPTRGLTDGLDSLGELRSLTADALLRGVGFIVERAES